jgi:hypothetical protein
LKTRGTTSNRNGIGARVTVVAGELRQTDEVRSGGSYLSHNDLRLHFGIGDEARVDEIHARWPSGAEEMFPGSEANREVLLVEGKGRSLNQSTQPESDAGRTGTR